MPPTEAPQPVVPRLVLTTLGVVYTELGILAARWPKHPRLITAVHAVGAALDALAGPVEG